MKYAIVFEEQETVRFAAEELQTYMGRITGVIPTKHHEAQDGVCNVYLGGLCWMERVAGLPAQTEELRDDGFVLDVTSTAVRITAKEYRGVLFGVYFLLRQAGCRWVCAGAQGEQIPSLPALSFAVQHTLQNPDFPVRLLYNSTDLARMELFLADYRDMLDWATKNGLNGIWLPTEASARTLIPDPDTMVLKPWLLREICRRDLRISFGGHNLRLFVDRTLFDSQPDMFRMQNGERRADGNFCPSSPQAMEMLKNGVRSCLNKLPQIRHLSVFFDDVFGGSWCDCPQCADMSAMEQSYHVVLELAQMVKAEYPGVDVSLPMYHDTLDIPADREDPCSNMMGEFAPRERCYTHAIDDASCRRNRTYWEQLQKASKQLPSMQIYEYYGDMILWNKIACDIPQVLIRDLQAYHELGIQKISMLTFNHYSTFAYKLNMLLFARGTWNCHTDAQAVKEELCEVVYGRQKELALDCYAKREAAAARYLTFCEYERIWDIRGIPVHQEAFMRRHVQGIQQAAEQYRACQSLLKQGMDKEDDAAIRYALQSDWWLMDISARQLDCHALQITAQLDKHAGGDLAVYRERMERCARMTEELRETLLSLPASLLGADQADRLISHLCNDQIRDYRKNAASCQ